MEKLFGTDGIRGVANTYPMTSEMALRAGRAAAVFFKQKGQKVRIVIGKDPRLSGDMLEYALASGICSVGGDVLLAGILPTPGVACLALSMEASAGIVISASHNPFFDNGIKIFKPDGCKLSNREEVEFEKIILSKENILLCRNVQKTGKVRPIRDSSNTYAGFLKRNFTQSLSLQDINIVLDCSNGATSNLAPGVFSDLGAEVYAMFNQPDGRNINAGCGSQHPEKLAAKVVESKAAVGFAFDGDGDRLIAVDETGHILTGDQVLAICTAFFKKKNRLKNNLVVSTIMSNMGLGVALKQMGVSHVKSDVGDRYVLEKMLSGGAVLGGEDSGHMIFLEHHTTGDGILAALQLLEVIQSESKPLSELARIMQVYPQILINVDVKTKPEINLFPEIRDVIHSVESNLGREGRVLVRYSGTQSLCRVMVEGPDKNEITNYCGRIAAVVKEKLN
ncbi:MAG: phosphoglucosamine mutase [Deltaproteobacteria bacterium]|nr:phosphoglucosamine mutase [Deltaproteobacteria bacterium]